MSEVKGTLELQRDGDKILVSTGIDVPSRQTVKGRGYITASWITVTPAELPDFLAKVGMYGGDYSSLLGSEPTADMVGVWFKTDGGTLVELGLLLPDCPN